MTQFDLSLTVFLLIVVGYFTFCVLFVLYWSIIEDGGILDRIQSRLHERWSKDK